MLEHRNDFVNALARFARVAFHEAALEIGVEVAQRLGELAAGFHVQRAVQFADDVNRALDVVVDGGVALGDFGDIEPDQRLVKRTERAVKQHQHQLSGRRGLRRNLPVGFPRIDGRHRNWRFEISDLRFQSRRARKPASWFSAASDG